MLIFIIYFVFQSTFMIEQEQSLRQLQHIRNMMERSSRFISLSGLSGIAAGACALVGAYFANEIIAKGEGHSIRLQTRYFYEGITAGELMGSRLLMVAFITFIAALALAFVFTYIRSRKNNIPLWGSAAKRVMINVAIPMVAGGFYILREIQLGNLGLVAPGCLIFYGLALVNASKYTFVEIRYLGYLQLLLGIANCWFIGYGLYFWAAGFGILHIIYGGLMWLKYERTGNPGNETIEI